MSSESSEIPESAEELPSLHEMAERLIAVEQELEQERKARQQAEERIDELEDELSNRTPLRWDADNPREIEVEHADGWRYPIGSAVAASAAEDDLDELDDRVRRLETDGVDPADVVGLTGDSEPILPIEDVIAQARSPTRGDPTSNKARAAVVFRAFGGRANSTKGGKLVLKSDRVRSILEDPEKGDMETANRNTVRRTMQHAAKLTSHEEDQDNRRARDEENLLTLEKRNGSLALVADRGEWNAYLSEVEGRM